MATTTPAPLPATMRAQHLTKFNAPYSLSTTVPLPTLSSPLDLLIRVSAAGYCHTDAVLATGILSPRMPPSLPHIGCHEFAGTVVRVPDSPAGAAAAFSPGDRVGVASLAYHPCGACSECASTGRYPQDDAAGFSVYCAQAGNLGLSLPGGWAEYAVVDARQVVRLPEELTALDTAPLMCAGVTVYAALRKAGLKRGQTVGILGAGGGVGHLGVQFAAAMGLRVVAVEAADGPLEVVKGLGVCKARQKEDGEVIVVDARKTTAEDVRAQLATSDNIDEEARKGVDAVLLLPDSQRAFDYATTLLRDHGTMVVLSFPEKGFHLDANAVVFRDISVIGSLFGSIQVAKEMLEFAARHGVRAVARTFGLEELNELVEANHAGGGGKFVVDLEK